MFKEPEWGNDIPSFNENLKPLSKKKKSKISKIQNISQEIPRQPKKSAVKGTKSKILIKLNNSLKKEVKYESKFKNQKTKANLAKLNNSNGKIKTKKQLSPLSRKIDFKKKFIKKDICKDETSSTAIHKINKYENNVKSFTKSSESASTCYESSNIIASGNKDMKKEIDIPNYDVDNLNEIIINAKKKNLVDEYKKEDNEETLFVEKASIKKKKNKLKVILEKRHNEINTNRSMISVNTGNELRRKMLDRLNAAKFRYLNEQLYTSSGSDAQKLFQSDPTMFQTYHQGYQQQVKKWPVNPLDLVVKRIQNMPKSHVIADLGCGEAALSRRVGHSVRSFDLVAAAPHVEVCDMAHTPLLASSVDVAVYCLALMGTDLTQYLLEANRILKVGGHLLIAEVESRFDDVDSFVKDVQRLGFTLKKLDKSHQVFFFMEFLKAREAPSKKSKLPTLTLKPCIYKKR